MADKIEFLAVPQILNINNELRMSSRVVEYSKASPQFNFNSSRDDTRVNGPIPTILHGFEDV